jgi:hypothetical protein
MRVSASLRTAVPAVLWASLFLDATALDGLDDYVHVDNPDTFYSALKPCPAACLGPLSNWTVYISVGRLAVCDQPMLLSFRIYNPLDDPGAIVKLQACTTTGGAPVGTSAPPVIGSQENSTASHGKRSTPSSPGMARREAPDASVCVSGIQTKVTL